MMALLGGPVHSAANIKWSKSPCCFASDLSTGELFGRLYNDAADIGFTLVNPKTGTKTAWYVSKEITDRSESEVVGWEMKPTPEAIKKAPKLKSLMLVVWND